MSETETHEDTRTMGCSRHACPVCGKLTATGAMIVRRVYSSGRVEGLHVKCAKAV
jgi:hypothetical protein